MSGTGFEVRTMVRGEIDLAVEWAAAEGWNPGLHDAGSFHAADPGGFLTGLLEGEPVAVISAVRYGAGFGFLGFYIVRPEYRGRGHGIAVWKAAMARLAGRNVGLDGVVAQQENYRRSGFQLAYRNVRYAGVSGGSAPTGAEIVPLSTLPFEAVWAYDRPLFPDERGAFLAAWLAQPGSIALGVLNGGTLTGYGVIRPCRSGYKIGPLFADSRAQAEALFTALAGAVEAGEPLYLDVAGCNREAQALAEGHGMSPVFETARMYTGEDPALPFGRLFGVTSFELG